ncbi:MAG TPA: hypothetical protein VFA39_15850 [Steroidobacteraceae bacterium]|nr:hypothetical protein [Steroidobacteraceae bacterium]
MSPSAQDYVNYLEEKEARLTRIEDRLNVLANTAPYSAQLLADLKEFLV